MKTMDDNRPNLKSRSDIADELRRMINDPDVKAADRLRALGMLSELLGREDEEEKLREQLRAVVERIESEL